MDDVSRMIEIDPIQGYTWRASHYETSRELDKAIADASKLVELQPGVAAPLELRSRLHTANGDTKAASIDLNTAIVLDPKSELNYWARIEINQKETGEEAKKAILADYEKLIEVVPGEAARVYHARASYLRRQKDYAGAIADYSKAIEKGETSEEAYQARAATHMLNADYVAAAEDFTKMIEQKPDTVELYFVRGYAYLRAGRLVTAASDYGVGVWRFIRDVYWPALTAE
jgi:tetratricopeptide (TPR) repeat protein